jgi:hypothetical protein
MIRRYEGWWCQRIWKENVDKFSRRPNPDLNLALPEYISGMLLWHQMLGHSHCVVTRDAGECQMQCNFSNLGEEAWTVYGSSHKTILWSGIWWVCVWIYRVTSGQDSKSHPSCWLLPMSGDSDLVWNSTKDDKGCIYQPFNPQLLVYVPPV